MDETLAALRRLSDAPHRDPCLASARENPVKPIQYQRETI
jgi:hypothetical protein